MDADTLCGARARAQTDILDHKEQQAGVAARRLQALEAQLDALRAELARSSAQAATLTVRRGLGFTNLHVRLQGLLRASSARTAARRPPRSRSTGG